MADLLHQMFQLNRALSFNVHEHLGIPNWVFYTTVLSITTVIFLYYMYQDKPKRATHNSTDQVSNKVRTPLRFERVPTNGIRLHTVIAGDPSKPLVILLHGFPEFWKAWENQIDELVAAGYYVMVPDQRGYNLSPKPKNIGDYKMTQLANDVLGLIEYAGKEKAYLAGHDWGALVSWYLITQRPEKFYKAVIVSAPHSNAAAKLMKTDPDQRKRLGYMKLFMLPFIPQYKLAKNNFQYLEETLLKTSNPGTFSSEDFRAYKLSWCDRGTINCLMNWYRTIIFRPTRFAKGKTGAKIPVKIIWGAKDHALKKELAEESLKYCENGSLDVIEDASHWVLHEQPRKVSKLIIDFYRSN
eukprot:CAMPEP_0176424766 /NCGR_PEP_ID=MMETSP0127-20121128/11020_1 /TAXON_ID=938130 /ORGANISM="Platyophrya macrostoma, Strain WH" /LENGTH=354 /DNA_ID=CAMNT_0017805861 /DNA_START=45 /DNA_END=1109 /DNA_ORIENTATION=-